MKLPFIRRLAAFVLILTLGFFSAFAAQAASDGQFRFPSASGSFLSGQEAFEGLSTEYAASALMDAATAQWDNPAVVERAFAALIAAGRIPEAESMARHMLELAPDNNLAKLVIATVALKERRYNSVIKELQDMGLADFVDISAAVIKAWARVGQSRLDLAFAELDEMSNGALDSFLVFHKALMADIAGDPAVLDLARTAYGNDPFLGRIVEFYARVLGNAGLRKAALDVLDTFQEEGLTHPTVQGVRADIEAGRLPGKFAPNIASAAAELYQGIGVALGRDGARDIAMVFLQLGLYLNPDAEALKLTVAQFYELAERFEAANGIYASIPRESPFRLDAIIRMAQNIDALGDRPEAIRQLKNIVATNPQSLAAVTALGDMYRLDEQFDESIGPYTQAIKLAGGTHPRDWRFFYLRGISNERRGEWEQAERDFLRALELNPTQPQVLNYLGYSWVDKGMNLQRALAMIEQAVKTNPQDGYIVDSLGWAFYKLNQFDEAVRILEQAVRLNPNDPEINDHLGDAYWRVGRRNEAYFQWNIAMDVDERGNVIERVLPKLENGLPELESGGDENS